MKTWLLKIFQTIVLTIASALVLGFFALIAWMAKSIYDINSSVNLIQKNQITIEKLQANQIDVYNKLIFELKENIADLENKQLRTEIKLKEKAVTPSVIKKPYIYDPKKLTFRYIPKNEKKNYRKFDNDIKQQIQHDARPMFEREFKK